MNTIAKIILSIVSLFFIPTTYAQLPCPDCSMTKPSFMYYLRTIEQMKVHYNLPVGFKEECYREDFRGEKKQMSFFKSKLRFSGDIDGKISSLDENFTILFDIPANLGSKDSLSVLRNNLHIYEINTLLMRVPASKLDYKKIRKKAEYCFDECARSRFNADTVITFQVKMPHNVTYYQYNHLKVIIIQKNLRTYIAMLCFYNDKAKKNLDHYIKALDGMFWFRDEE